LNKVEHFQSNSATELFQILDSGNKGIADEEAQRRLQNTEKKYVRKRWQKDILLLLSQYRNPIVWLLVFAVLLSLVLGEYSDSFIILFVLSLTGIFGFIQERSAGLAVEKLKALVRNLVSVRRNGIEKEIGAEEVVPGDIILLNAGDIIPADAYILTSNDLHVNEAALTGESFPAEKMPGVCSATDSIIATFNAVFKGTSVVNGTAEVLAVNTGLHTEIGKIASHLETNGMETAFERGIRKFGYLLMRITAVIVLLILTLNILFHKPVVESLLFALALAVGLTPELLPAIVTVTLSAGARRLAARKVIVKKLSAIQNLGEIDVLCCDKTGTLTEGLVKVQSAVDINGEDSEKVREYIYLNAFFESGFSNPIDEAIRSLQNVDVRGRTKKDEVPYDFIRKRLSLVVNDGTESIMITKGAVSNILECCTRAELPDGTIVALSPLRKNVDDLFLRYSKQGFRTLGLCYKDVTDDPVINKDDEQDMVLLGFVCFYDPPRKGIADSIEKFKQAGISIKLITGDNRLVAAHVAGEIGFNTDEILTGTDLHLLTSDALQQKVNTVEVFAEIEPIQKERIVRALQKNGHAVGYLGDGINDANALKAADAGISMHNAVDVAKEAAPVVLMEKNIDVILDGVLEGRRTFVNTMKYVFVTTSANFGNMFSMAVASLLLPFLPLLPTQILLNNFLSDIPALTIASDKVDDELIARPCRWDIRYIKRFMIIFGLQSSLFDFLTFAALLFVFHAGPDAFRTGWFMESLLTEILILLVIRTHRPFFKSRPSKYLVMGCAIAFVLSVILPWSPFAAYFNLVGLPPDLLAGILVIAILYVLVSEWTKKYTMKRI
jgi:P-type Mg2+ transporter